MNENGTGMSVADVAALSGGGFGGFGNGFEGLIYLAVIASMFGGGWGNGFGFGGGRGGFPNAIGYENLATSNEVQRGFDNQNLQAQTRDILAAVTSGTAQSVAATNQSFHDTLAVVTDKYGELQRDVAALAVGQANALANQNACCCDTKMLIQASSANTDAQIARNNYEAAMRDAATNANFTAQIQGVKDMIAQNKIEALQGQVNQLQLAQATAGVLRFPNSWSYGAGPFPPIFGGCCGNSNNI